MVQNMEISNEYVANLPNGRRVVKLLDMAIKEARKLKLCDAAMHPESGTKVDYGRYEPDKQIIWVHLGLDTDVISFTIAHELGHVVQELKGYPRISLTDSLRKDFPQDQLRDLIAGVHNLTRVMNGLVLDPGADEFARTNNLLTRSALEHISQEDRKKACILNDNCLPSFCAEEFRNGLEETLERAKRGGCLNSYQNMCGLLKVAILAVIYATIQRRYKPYGLFDSLYKVYQRKRPKIQRLGEQLALLANTHQLETSSPGECLTVGQELIAHLRIPEGVMGFKIDGKWCH